MSDCLFCKIAAGEIPSKKLYEDDKILAFYDISPIAPVHFLVIPKEHIQSVDMVNEENSAVIAYIFQKIGEIAKESGLTNGYRVISNCGADARSDRTTHPFPCTGRKRTQLAGISFNTGNCQKRKDDTDGYLSFAGSGTGA